ncbi:thiamine pyrophosphate-binding protein [Streptosporangium sp. NPDC004631]
MSPTVNEMIAHELAQLGTRACFGLMGEDTAHLTAALVAEGVRYYSARHEAIAVGMADGYAAATGRLGVCAITRGPGFLNALTAATTAARAHLPLLIITGEAPTKRWYLPDLKVADQRRAAEVAGLVYAEARTADEVPDALRSALQAALSNRAAVLSVVANVFDEPAGKGWPLGEIRPDALPSVAPDAALVRRTAALLTSAERPLLLAGRGALQPGARELMLELAERTGALVGTSVPAKDLFLGSPLDVGVLGGFTSEPSGEVLGDLDCVLAVGASLTDFTSAERTLFRQATTVQVTVDADAFDAYYPVEVKVHADAVSMLEALLTAIPARHAGPTPALHAPEVLARLCAPRYDGPDESDGTGVDPRVLLSTLDAMLPRRRQMVLDLGRFSAGPMRYVRTSGPRSSRFAADFGAIGCALGPALGTAVACPDSPTVLYAGDGGFMLTLSDLVTAARYRLPLVIVVMNDRAFGAERNVLAAHGFSQELAELPDTDFAAVARAMGLDAATIRSADDLGALGERLAHLDGPLLLDCKLRPDRPVRYFKLPGGPKTEAGPVAG